MCSFILSLDRWDPNAWSEPRQVGKALTHDPPKMGRSAFQPEYISC